MILRIFVLFWFLIGMVELFHTVVFVWSRREIKEMGFARYLVVCFSLLFLWPLVVLTELELGGNKNG